MREELKKIDDFLKESKVYYLLTSDRDNRPHGRPWNLYFIEGDKLYIGTASYKGCYREIKGNPYIQILASCGKRFMRINARAIEECNTAIVAKAFENNPALEKQFNEQTGNQMIIFRIWDVDCEVINGVALEDHFSF